MTISNQPPPFEHWSLIIEDLTLEAQNFLDGEPIANQGQADAVALLLEGIRKASKSADAERAAEKKPHDDASKAVQAKWRPLIDKCDLAASVAKKALTPWLEHLEAEQRAIAEKARQEALEAQRKAEEARKWDMDLSAQEEAAEAQKQADIATAIARKADKAKPQAQAGRAIGLRTSYRAEVTDYGALLAHYKRTRPDDLKAWLSDQAQKDVRAGMRVIPGVLVHEERSAA